MATTVKAADNNTGATPSSQDRLKEYWRSLLFEWKKISYPDRKQLYQSTLVVFVFVMVFITVIAAYDWVVGTFFHKLILPPA